MTKDWAVYAAAISIVDHNGDARAAYRQALCLNKPEMHRPNPDRIRNLFNEAIKVWASSKADTEQVLIRARIRAANNRRRGTGFAT